MRVRVLRSPYFDPSSAVMALVLGVTVWVVAVVEQANFVTDSFPQPIPLEVRNLEADIVLVGQVPAEVAVRLRAPQSIWLGLSPADLEAYIDLAGTGMGLRQVSIQVESRNRLVRVVEISPSQITVTLDRRAEKEVGVEVTVTWDKPLGYTMGEPTVTPQRVVVSGAESLLEQVSHVVADLSLEGERATVDEEVALTPVDDEGNKLEGLEVNPATATVQVPIEPRVGFRELAVRPAIRGNVSSGYWISNIRVIPSTVTILGDPEVVGRLSGFLDTEPVDVQGASGDLEQEVDLVVPQGVELLGARTVLVRVEVSPVLGGQTFQVEPQIEGLQEGLIALFSPDTVEVIISGPLPALQALEPEDVQVIIDLADRGPGTYLLPPQIQVPEPLLVQSWNPSQLEVVITRRESPS